jgi:hypothetical protein
MHANNQKTESGISLGREMRGAIGPNVLGRSTAESGREDLLQLESATDHLTPLKTVVWRRQLVNGGFHAA